MKNQVLSIEQMQELEKLGIDTSNSVIGWFKWNNEDTWYLRNETTVQRREKVETMIENNCFDEDDYQSYKYTFIPTFTLQDILEMLPKTIVAYKDNSTLPLMITITGSGKYTIVYDNPFYKNGKKGLVISESLLEAAFNMLKWVKQNNYI